MNTRVKWVGWGTGWSLLGAAWLAACSGGGFQRADCTETHTCAVSAAGDGSGPEAGGAATDAGGASTAAGTKATGATGGQDTNASGSTTGGTAEAGGGTGNGGEAPTGCTTDDDCSDGDPKNGVELCQLDGSCIAGNAPPFVLSVVPTADSKGVAIDSAISITFNEPIDVATANANNIQLKLGDTVIDATIVASGSSVTLTSKSPLVLLGDYTISVAGVRDAGGTPMLASYDEKFTTADGSWSTRTIASGGVYQLSDTIPMTATGDALIAWTASPTGTGCPPKAAWYRRGTEVGADKAMALPGASDCNSIVAGGNVDGVAAMAWQIPDAQHGTYVEQFRGGKWAAGDGKVSADMSTMFFRLGAAPGGVLSFFYSSGKSASVLRSNAAGKWAATADALTTAATTLSAPQVVYDANGNGLAVWQALDPAQVREILVSYYSTNTGKWSSAEVLPGSVRANADPNYEVGPPSIAMDEQGGAIAIWFAAGGNMSNYLASRYEAGDGWSAPVIVTPPGLHPWTLERPALVFDGNSFLAAFVAQDSKNGWQTFTYTMSFDRQQDTWSPPERRQAAGEPQSSTRAPQLVSDGRGHQTLFWIKSSPQGIELEEQRQIDGQWSATTPISSVDDKNFETGFHTWTVGSNASGLMTVAWRVYNDTMPIGIKLASFF